MPLATGSRRHSTRCTAVTSPITANDCEVLETAWLVRPALAKTLLPEPEVDAGVGTGSYAPETGGTGPAISGGTDGADQKTEWEAMAVVLSLRAGNDDSTVCASRCEMLPWENWLDIYNEVIQPLANEGAEVSCQVVILAKGDAAIRENTVELG